MPLPPHSTTSTHLAPGPWVFLDLAGLRLQQILTHLSKYWSDGGSSSLPEVVKWHACLWEERYRGAEGISH